MDRISCVFFLSLISHFAFSQNWGTTIPQMSGGYDVAYISALNTTYASNGSTVFTLRHDSVITSMTGPAVNNFRYLFNKLYAATEGSNSFRYLDSTWKAVPNVALNARSFYLDTLGANILILGEFSEPAPGHVVQYDGSGVSAIAGLNIYSNASHCATLDEKKFISYESPYSESHLLVWDGETAEAADVPDNYGVANLFIAKSNLYATLFFLGNYQLWKYDGVSWQYVLKLPLNFYCQGAFNDDDNAIYFFGSGLLKCELPDTTITKIENPITNSIYAMTKDRATGFYYLSSNYIFWWNGKSSTATSVESIPETPALFRFDTQTNTLFVDYDKEWEVVNSLNQIVVTGKGKATRNLQFLPAGTYMIVAKETRWTKNKFQVIH